MTTPNFTPEENYVIHCVKAQHADAGDGYMWGYVIATLICGLIVTINNSEHLLFCVLLGFCGFRIYEYVSSRKWSPVWHSIITKYEEALAQRSDDDDPSSKPTANS